jgi:DNA-binding transcriptional ArsR family regulator
MTAAFHVRVIIHVYMNDDTNVNAWQDGIVTEQHSAPSADQVAEQALITTVEQLKALADPTRMAILEQLMMSSGHALPVMSVKELAEALREPQTKLYRHVKVLESAGLIRVAATRMVSGIAEQRYQACQRDLDFAAGLMRQHVDEAEALLRAVFDQFRNGFLAARRAPSPPDDDNDDATSLRNSQLIFGSSRRTPAEIAAVRARLSETVSAYFDCDDSDEPDAMLMSLLVGDFVHPGNNVG